jgi:hypothetical protein
VHRSPLAAEASDHLPVKAIIASRHAKSRTGPKARSAELREAATC